MRPEWIARHEKENYTLGRFSPAFFPCAGALCLGSSPGGTVSQAFICHFNAFLPSNVQEYGASRKNAIQGQNTSASGTKKSLYIDNYIYRCYALGNYKAVKGV